MPRLTLSALTVMLVLVLAPAVPQQAFGPPAMQAGQHEPLATGDPEPAHTAIEFRPQQAGDVRDHDTNVFFGIWHGGPL